ncbi:HK97 family phage prohead protease [Consotaella salsifontis]|uniref:Prohead serine protease domain-containing protein n=1 Tax=Consotaella salsifontis TaxID=1365950 RepID=A0A1T4SJK3_9HYPH|nr:HK97 family phage prohead protease [Consotaella salsifontis]SKA28470.1 hypothetical protein SAMN05428963_11183 [Consotaella salsifontis]
MLTGGFEGSTLELRASRNGGRRIRGRFPYNKRAVLSDGGRTGRPRKEQFAPGAFTYSLEAPADIHLLVGHSFDRPLASKNNGTLVFNDTPEALTFDAEIVPEVADTSYAQDLFALITSRLVFGLSPGFRIPPPAAVPLEEAETVEEEPPSLGRALIRTIFQAILFELSIVTRPAYDEATVEARNWQTTPSGIIVPTHHLNRWRL